MAQHETAALAAPKCRILTLDGGGSKGMYTLGILNELEANLGRPLCDAFPLIYGTSTGAIIAALIGLGKPVAEILGLYRAYIPVIMGQRNAKGRTTKLQVLTEKAFGGLDFTAFKTHVGIMCTNWGAERPLVFKTDVGMAHGRKGSFLPGFGCSIASAVMASSAAFPFFERQRVGTKNQGAIEAADGGFTANNPTLFALIDALGPMKTRPEDVRLLSLGCGNYPQKPPGMIDKIKNNLDHVQLVHKVLSVNANTTELLVRMLYPHLIAVRINETFQKPELATDFLEADSNKLELMFQEGQLSFGQHEKAIMGVMGE